MRMLVGAFTLAAMLLSGGASAWSAVTAANATTSNTPISEIRRGTMVTVTGSVDRILDTDEFRLRDTSGAIRVYVGPNWVPVDVGEQVTVRGFVDNDLIKELYAREIVRADGTVTRFSHRYE